MKHAGERIEGGGIVRVRGRSAEGAPDCVGSHMRAYGSGLRACEAFGRPVVEEVRGATESEGIVSVCLFY